MLFVVTILSLLVYANARCDNACSGHGKCLFDDVCQCFDNWGMGLSMDSGDCSDRICPFELAWVDTPDSMGKTHKYAECAGKGICDRESGECECFEGYEGKGCQRTTCPNLCSGHGTCEYIEDLLPPGLYGGKQQWLAAESMRAAKYFGWDKGKTRGCVCDAQYGDVDCSKRMCPYGTDILDQRDNVIASGKYQKQKLRFVYTNTTAPGLTTSSPAIGNSKTVGRENLEYQTFALTFRSKLNETFTTIPIVYHAVDPQDMADDIRVALKTLPNKVIDGVDVAVSANSDGDIEAIVTFSGDSVQGPQNLLWVEAYECASGCQPKITGLDIRVEVSALPSTPTTLTDVSKTWESQASDYNSYECGRRGTCDYATGLCSCFTGYTGESCNTQTTLV